MGLGIAFSQVAQTPITIQSPNVSSLGLYGEVPVSYFAGIPNVNIPLYEFNEHGIKIPIELSYHASGFRPDMHPGWVGMGWNLSCGGVISRTVKGIPDEYLNTTGSANVLGLWQQSQGTPVNGVASTNILNNDNWNQLTRMKDVMYIIGGGTGLGLGTDSEPDEFSFSFPGGSGKFYLDHLGNWKVKCDKPVKVALTATTLLDIPFQKISGAAFIFANGNFKSFPGFIITDEQGTKFIFGENTDAIEYQIPFFQQTAAEWIASAWHLTKIIDAEGNEVNLTYEKEYKTMGKEKPKVVDVFIDQLAIATTANLGTYAESGGTICSSFSTPQTHTVGELVSPCYLTSIKGKNCQIQFDRSTSNELAYTNDVYLHEYNPTTDYANYSRYSQPPTVPTVFSPVGVGGQCPYLQTSPDASDNIFSNYIVNLLVWKKLDKIKVKDANDNQIKEFVFGYNSSKDERLMLKSLKEFGRQEADSWIGPEHDEHPQGNPPYEFSYYGPSKVSGHIAYYPHYLSRKTDHWGFYNQKLSTLSGIDLTTQNYDDYKTNRAAATEPNVIMLGTLSKIVYPTGGVTEFTYEQNDYSQQVHVTRTKIDPNFSTTSPLKAGGLRIRKIVTYDPLKLSVKQTKEYFYIKKYTPPSIDGSPGTPQSSGILGWQPQYWFNAYYDYYVDEGSNYYTSLFSSQGVIPASNNSAGTHVGYSEVAEVRSDGSYTRYLFSNFDTDPVGSGTSISYPYCDEPTTVLQTTRTPYEQRSSLESTRGLLLSEKIYTKLGGLLRDRKIHYAALDKANSYCRAMNGRVTSNCGGTSTVVYDAVAYKNYTFSFVPDKETVTEYDQNSLNPIVSVHDFTYSNTYRQIASDQYTDSKGIVNTTYYHYPYDALSYTPTGTIPTINETTAYMVHNNMIGNPLEILKTKKISATEMLTGSKLTRYGVFGGHVKPSKEYKFESSSPIAYTSTSCPPFSVGGYSSANGESITYDNTHLAEKLHYDYYDTKGNITQYALKDNFPTSYLWDYKSTYPIAEVKNAAQSDIAYTSFEADGTGNWSFSSFPLTTTNGLTTGGITGKNAFNLGKLTTTTISKTSLVSTNTYTLTYWSNNGTVTIAATGTGSSVSQPSEPLITKKINGNTWYLYSHLVKKSTAISITGTVTIDELRLYPINAQMTTFTYDPLVGMTSQCDVNNKITYYEYDDFNRLQTVKDQDGNIVKKYDYQYKQTP